MTPGSADARLVPAKAAVTPVASVSASAVSAKASFLVIGEGSFGREADVSDCLRCGRW